MTAARPRNKQELQKREAAGVIRASRFIRRYARSHKPITVDTFRNIHKEIFKDAWPEIAGVLRQQDEDVKITGSSHLPPHWSEVSNLMHKFDTELPKQLESLKFAEGQLFHEYIGEAQIDAIQKILEVTAWVHYKVTYIHPFREGNGRTARLAANLILERYGLVGISPKIAPKNKDRYRQALAQIDKVGDYEPLINLIAEGLIGRFEGVPTEYYTK
jgi:Fic family protein